MRKLTMKKIENVIELHEKMSGAYFFSSPCNSAGRRSYEAFNSLTTEFTHDKQKIKIIQETTCSAKNIYYKMRIFVNNKEVKKDIRFLKKMIKA